MKRPTEKTAPAKGGTLELKPKSLAAKGAVHLYGRLLGIMRARGEDSPTQSAEDFATYAFTELAPRNAAEVLLCAQMTATWETGMAMLSGAKLTIKP